MNPVVIPPILKNNPSKLPQGVFRIRNVFRLGKPREIYHNIDFSENNFGIKWILWSEVIFIYHIYSSEILTLSKT